MRWIGKLLRGSWYLLATLLVLAAALVSLGQYYFPYLDEHREDLLAAVSGELPFGVEVGSVHAEWTGLAPTFEASDLRLFARDEPSLSLLWCRHAVVRIDLVRSLFALAPRLRSIVADEVQLGFSEDGDGRWRIAGLGARRAPSDAGEVLAFFLAIEEIRLQRTRLELHPQSAAPVEIKRAELGLENFRHLRRLRLDAEDDQSHGRLRAIIEAEGDPRDRQAFTARAHARLDALEMQRLQPLLGPALRLPAGRVSGDLWAEVEPGGRVGMRAVLDSPEFTPAPLAGGRPLAPLEALETRLAASWADGHGTLWVDRLRGRWFGQDLAIDHLRVDSARTGEHWLHSVAADYLDVGALTAVVVGSEVLGDAWGRALRDLAPYGGLVNTRIDLRTSPGQRPAVWVRTRLEEFSASPWKDAPGVRNVNGYLEADGAGGSVAIDSGAVTLEFPRLYRADLDFQRIQGRVDWRIGADGVTVGSELLRAADRDAELSAAFRLRLLRDPAAEDEFSLAVGLRGGDAAMRHRYLPYTVAADMQRWLDASIQQGSVDAALFTLRRAFGRADGKRPFDLQLALEAHDAVVDYHPDWPPLSGARARVLVDGTQVRVWADAGRIFGSRVEEALVKVQLARPGPRVEVRGTVLGDLADGLRIINESPLARQTGGALANWTGSGSMRVALELELPLDAPPTPGNARVAVRAALDGARLDLRDFGVEVTQLGGGIEYTLDGGLRSEELKGLLWDRPVVARAAPPDGDPRRVAVELHGVAAVPDVQRWLGADSDGLLSGEAPFALRVEQRESGFALSLDSSLVGVSSELPAPLAKDALAELPLSLELLPQAPGRVLRARLGDLGSAALDWSPSQAPRGEISLGDEARHGGEDARLTGVVEAADAGAWIGAVQRLVAANAGRGGATDGFRIDDLQVGSATLWGAEAHALRLDSRREDGEFVLGFEADMAAGSLRWPRAAGTPLRLQLARLDLQPFLPAAAPAAPAGEAVDAGASPAAPVAGDNWDGLAQAKVPPIDVDVQTARLGERDLGSWRFRVATEGDAFALTDAHATLPGAEITGLAAGSGGSMRVRWPGGGVRTAMALRVKVTDMRRFVANWGLAESIDSADGRIDIAMEWPGNPALPSTVSAAGMMDFRFSDGRLLGDVGNNPLMRAIGLFSFNQVLRRLKLDFKDFYQSGLAFDRLEAVIDFGDGQAKTRAPIALRGPTARIRLTGQTDLRSHEVDGDLIVTLPIGSNLPWVAVLAGGLPAAAGVLVASRVFENELGKFSSAVYRVSGLLEEPKLEFIRVFDAETEDGAQAKPAEGEAKPGAGDTKPGDGGVKDGDGGGKDDDGVTPRPQQGSR